MASSHSRIRFIELMTELFQLDEAESLDFGLYRVIRQHNREVCDFLGEIKTVNGEKRLQGGQLDRLLDAAFAQTDDEAEATLREQIKTLESQLGLSSRMTDAEREIELKAMENKPLTRQAVMDYRALVQARRSGQTVELDRDEVLNRLYQFFARHYQDGDFIVERRYGRDGSRYIRSTGEDTEFHWATEDMYYIKSGDIFTDYSVRLSSGQRLVFSVVPETLSATRASLKPNDKAHYALSEVVVTEDGGVQVVLDYLTGGQTETKKRDIVAAIQSHLGGDESEIKRWLNRFIVRNQSDFFIHKRLQEALTDDLDLFLKIEVLDADQLLAGGDVSQRMAKVAQIVREVGRQIIAFLATLEDFQKQLWEKKKLVFDTRYVITLDRIAKLAGEDWLNRWIDVIVEAQQGEWSQLGLGDIRHAQGCVEDIPGDLATPDRRRWLPLPVDTLNLDDEFKWALLAAVTAENGLDEALDGVAIHSDNWQALNTLQAKYREQVKCIYIDPPYNTNASGIPYKNGYRHSSWGALMHNRLVELHNLLPLDGALFVSIDKAERTQLEHILSYVFGADNRIEELIWLQNTNNGQAPNYSTNHEYVEVYAKHRITVEHYREMFREPKPGYEQVMELIDQLNQHYPPVAQIETELKALYQRHRLEYRESVEAQGLEWENEKGNDPWRGLFNYSRAEYRDANGNFVPEEHAIQRQAQIWIWRESDLSMPANKQVESTRDPNHPNYRFYRPQHPITGKPCPHPKSGWKFPYRSDADSPDKRTFAALDHDQRIAWGENETKIPQIKRMLHEVETNVGKSVFRDYSDGEKQTSALFGKSGVFLSPKHTDFVSRFILQGSKPDSIVLDCFGGSGSTAHAVMNINRLDKTQRKFIIVEVNKYFHTLIIPRLKKVSASMAWKDGKAKALNGHGLFMRVQTLEQYEDTLQNLDHSDTLQTGLSFDDPAFRLRYRLNRNSRAVYCGIDHFRSPWGYTLCRVEGAGHAPQRQVDLIESLIYLLGLSVERLYREPEGVVITGKDHRQHSVTVLFRDCDHDNSTRWCEQKLNQHKADRVLTNHAATLSFKGCDRFEAIEAVFAQQFER